MESWAPCILEFQPRPRGQIGHCGCGSHHDTPPSKKYCCVIYYYITNYPKTLNRCWLRTKPFSYSSRLRGAGIWGGTSWASLPFCVGLERWRWCPTGSWATLVPGWLCAGEASCTPAQAEDRAEPARLSPLSAAPRGLSACADGDDSVARHRTGGSGPQVQIRQKSMVFHNPAPNVTNVTSTVYRWKQSRTSLGKRGGHTTLPLDSVSAQKFAAMTLKHLNSADLGLDHGEHPKWTGDQESVPNSTDRRSHQNSWIMSLMEGEPERGWLSVPLPVFNQITILINSYQFLFY